MNEVINFEAIENNETIQNILKEKFAVIALELQKVMKVASKGERKGLLIFKPDASRLIYAIEDKFIQYIVRSIFDNFQDIRNGIIWRIHCNELFNGDFIKAIFRKIDITVDSLENEYTAMREIHIHNKELYGCHELIRQKYQYFLSERRINNVFNVNNPLSIPFYTVYNQLKANVKRLHPRVPDSTMDAYIEKDYSLRQEKEKIEKEFLETFEEYRNAQTRIKEIYDFQHKEEKELREKIESEYLRLDYKAIRPCIEKLVNQFTNVIVNSIMSGTINFN